MELENCNTNREDLADRLRQTNLRLKELEQQYLNVKKDVTCFKDALETSQKQYSTIEKKYNKAKKLIREFQKKEIDMMHREEFYQQLLQEKDNEYNALVKKLKDRVISLEQVLLETQAKAGLPVRLPYDSINVKQLTPIFSRKMLPPLPPPSFLPLLRKCSLQSESDVELSDIEDGQLDSCLETNDKVSTVERKVPIKDEFDQAVPPHELLDVSALKSKADLVSRSGLANRQPPSAKKGSLSNSSSVSFTQLLIIFKYFNNTSFSPKTT